MGPTPHPARRAGTPGRHAGPACRITPTGPVGLAAAPMVAAVDADPSRRRSPVGGKGDQPPTMAGLRVYGPATGLRVGRVRTSSAGTGVRASSSIRSPSQAHVGPVVSGS